MHEVSIAHTIVLIAEDYARRNGANNITKVGLRIGEFSGVVPEALETAFEVAKRDTIAKDAQLKIVKVPVIAFCQNCQCEFEVVDIYGIASCPQCAALSHDLKQGQELDVSYLEVS
jgi:hydrogenase nickel incorporation protein HypA/HybF